MSTLKEPILLAAAKWCLFPAPMLSIYRPVLLHDLVMDINIALCLSVQSAVKDMHKVAPLALGIS